MNARAVRAVLAAAVLAFPAAARCRELADACVGGKWDEIVAQSGILHARKFPEYGLSEKLASDCPAFVNAVLSAESLDAAAKRKAFADVAGWSHDRRLAFYLKLRIEVQKASDEFWGRGGRW
jgi:hypothetical protein